MTVIIMQTWKENADFRERCNERLLRRSTGEPCVMVFSNSFNKNEDIDEITYLFLNYKKFYLRTTVCPLVNLH
jgi:hypothetical protein